MADPLPIIDESSLASYAGVNVGDFPTIWVDLANGVVTDGWRNPTTSIPSWVKGIAFEVGARPIRNPKGLSSWSRAIDDGSRTERLPDDAARAGIYLTPTETARLAGQSRRRSRFGTIRSRVGY